jgi:glycosyltransferase involved in cell wall biosynthesis
VHGVEADFLAICHSAGQGNLRESVANAEIIGDCETGQERLPRERFILRQTGLASRYSHSYSYAAICDSVCCPAKTYLSESQPLDMPQPAPACQQKNPLGTMENGVFAAARTDESSRPGRRMPVVLAVTECVSGVTTWSQRLREEFAGHPRYDLQLLHVRHPLDLSNIHTPGYDLYASNIDEARAVIRELAPVVLVPNYVWELHLASCEPGVSCLGMCHSDSLQEYYLPLTWYEPNITHFIAVSPECAAGLTARIPFRAGAITTLPYGVPVPEKLTRDYQTNPLRIMYAGRLAQPQKRVGDFVPLVRHLRALRVPFVFDIVGDGDELQPLQQAMEQKCASAHVRFYGRRSFQEVERMWTKHDIVVQVSDFEGTSISMLEAMAHGVVPVVTSAGSGVNGVIRHKKDGFVVPVGDMRCMARTIAMLAKKPSLLSSVGRAARGSAQKYSLGLYRERFTQLLDRIVAADRNIERARCDGGFGGPHPLYVQNQIISEQRKELANLRQQLLDQKRLRDVFRNLRKRIGRRPVDTGSNHTPAEFKAA